MSVLGYVMGEDVEGDDLDGDDLDGDDTMGARRRRRHRGHVMALPAKPKWRQGEVAPGIQAPNEGLELLTLEPDSNGGTFDTTNIGAVITFTAKPQRPFQAERLIALVSRVPDAVAGVPAGFVVSDGIFVGTQLQQLTRGGNFNLEVFSPTAFGVRMRLSPAAPGIDLTIGTRILGPAPTGTQAFIVSLQFLGHSLR